MKTLKNTVLGVMMIFLLYSCSSKNEQRESVGSTVGVVTYYPTLSAGKGFYFSGEITAKQTSSISTRMMGYIERIYVKPGDRVVAGELLVTINSADIQARKAQVQAMLTETMAAAANARRDYERFVALHKQNSVSDKELENVSLQNTSLQAKVQMVKQQMNEVDAMLAYMHIRAPFSGVVTQKMMDEGNMANPGMPILMVEQNDDLQVVASIAESYVPYVNKGDIAEITVKSLGIKLSGIVTELSPSAHKTGGQYAVKLAIEKGNDKIYPGMFVNVSLPDVKEEDSAAGIMIDKRSIVYREQLTGVYVVEDQNQAILRWVRLGKTIGGQVEVLSGVSQNERVILSAAGKLYNGVNVSISK